MAEHAEIIDGKALALTVREEVKVRAEAFAKQHGRQPGLHVVLVGDDPASQVYVRNKERAAAKCGIAGEVHRLPADTTMDALLAKVAEFNAAQDIDGILLKPDGFDPSKKYPMMVYFYERNSDNLHRYYPPAAGRSIICHSFYVSRGYLVFIPDIPYKTGKPGDSAAGSIIPGVKHMIAQGFVDQDRIGMQGHSWGGYQTAYLVTQTDMFACAESGAPVSNMTSAYGGIRWGSGLSRMF